MGRKAVTCIYKCTRHTIVQGVSDKNVHHSHFKPKLKSGTPEIVLTIIGCSCAQYFSQLLLHGNRCHNAAERPRRHDTGPQSVHAGTAVQQQVSPGEREMARSLYARFCFDKIFPSSSYIRSWLSILKLDRALAFLIDSNSLQLSQQVRHFTGLFLSGARSFERWLLLILQLHPQCLEFFLLLLQGDFFL